MLLAPALRITDSIELIHRPFDAVLYAVIAILDGYSCGAVALAAR
jgi:hypothetical protein